MGSREAPELRSLHSLTRFPSRSASGVAFGVKGLKFKCKRQARYTSKNRDISFLLS